MNQQPERDAEVDWLIAQKVKGATEKVKHVWDDYSPSSDPREAYCLIERFKIDTRYFHPELYPEHSDSPWLGGLQYRNRVCRYYTAWAPTPLMAGMRALANCLRENDINF